MNARTRHLSGAIGLLSVLAIGMSLAAPAYAAPRDQRNDHRGAIKVLPAYNVQSEGQISAAISPNEFVIALAGGDALAVNTTASTRIVNDLSASTSTSTATTPAAVPAAGEYAVVTYHFDATQGAVASQVILSDAPIATGRPHRLDGMVTGVGNGSFTLEDASGVSFTIDTLPTTQMRAVAGAGSTGALAVGDFAQAWVRSGSGVNDATVVTYGTQPNGLGLRGQTVRGTVTAIAGQILTLQLGNGGLFAINVLPGARILVNGQVATLSQVTAQSRVTVQGIHFVGVYYATMVAAS